MTHQQLTELISTNVFESDLDRLDEREFEVFSMLAQGYTNSRICLEMGIQQDHLLDLKSRIQKKFGLRSELELIRYAAKHRV